MKTDVEDAQLAETSGAKIEQAELAGVRAIHGRNERDHPETASEGIERNGTCARQRVADTAEHGGGVDHAAAAQLAARTEGEQFDAGRAECTRDGMVEAGIPDNLTVTGGPGKRIEAGEIQICLGLP